MKSNLFIIPILSLTFLISGCGSDNAVDETTTELTTEQTTEANTEQTTENNLFLDVINIENHPFYLGKLEDAINIWQDYKDYVFIYDYKNSYGYKSYNENTILSIKGLKEDGYITDIDINLKNSNQYIDLNEALDIAYEYINSEYINEYFIFDNAEKVYDSSETMYIINYMPKNFNEHSRSRFYCIVDISDDVTNYIRICNSLQRSINSNNYKFEPYEISDKLKSIGKTEN